MNDNRDAIVLNRSEIARGPCAFHASTRVEIALVEEGRGIHDVGGTCCAIDTGDLSVVNAGVAHQFVPGGGASMRVIRCLIRPDYLSDLCGAGHAGGRLYSPFCSHDMHTTIYNVSVDMQHKGKNTLQIHHLLDQMFLEYSSRDPGFAQILDNYLRILIHKIMRMSDEKRHVYTDRRADKIANIMTYLRAHSREDLNAKTLAALFHMSAKHLSTLFKSLTHVTITEYLQRTRVEKAIALLKDTDLCIRDVAFEIGYNDVTFFYNIFRRYTGQNPSALRSSTFPFCGSEERENLPAARNPALGESTLLLKADHAVV